MGHRFLLKNRRIISYLLVLLLLLSLVFAVGCEKKVRVRTGTRIICKYGDVIKDDTKFVKVPQSKAGSYYVRTVRRLCKKHREVERLYAKAQQAAASGNEQEAKELVKEIAKSDPNLQAATKVEDAKGQVAILGQILNKERQEAAQAAVEVQPQPQAQAPPAGSTGGTSSGQSSGGTTGTSGGTGDSNTQPGTETSTPAPASLISVFPTILPGYNKISETQDLLSASRLYDALDNQKVKFLTISVEQFTNAAEAQKWINSNKRYYGKDGREASVKGNTAYFGTDGREFAYLGWLRGSVSVELEMLAESGSPADLYNDMVTVGNQTN